jgi:hypothetical protein
MKNLLIEINRQLSLMSVNGKPVLLNEDGLLSTIVNKLRKSFDSANTLPVDKVSGKSPGKSVDGIEIDNIQFGDIQDALNDWENLYPTLTQSDISKLRTLIEKDNELINDIFEQTIEETVSSIYNRFPSLEIDSDTKLYEFLRGQFTNQQNIINRKGLNDFLDGLNSSGDPLKQIVYDISNKKILDNVIKLSRGGEIESLIDLNNELFNINKWARIGTNWTDKDNAFINSVITPTVKQSLRNFFTKFSVPKEIENFQKYLKIYNQTSDATQKEQLRKYLITKYSWMAINKNETFKILREWISSVGKKYNKDFSSITGEIEKAVNDNDLGIIFKLAEYDNVLKRTASDFVISLKSSIEPSLLNAFTIITKRKAIFKNNPETKQLRQEILNNTLNLIKSGSSKGFPGGETWMKVTKLNKVRARKLYATEVFIRYVKYSLTYAILKSVGMAVNSVIQKIPSNDTEVQRCKTALKDEKFLKGIELSPNPNEFLISSGCTYFVLMAIESREKGASKVFLDNLLPNINLDFKSFDGWDFLNTVFEVSPMLIDNIINDVIRLFVSSFEEGDSDLINQRLNELKSKVEGAAKEVESELGETTNQSPNNTQPTDTVNKTKDEPSKTRRLKDPFK